MFFFNIPVTATNIIDNIPSYNTKTKTLTIIFSNALMIYTTNEVFLIMYNTKITCFFLKLKYCFFNISF